jgi:hypothetical protein
MPLLNYTTTVPVSRTVAEVHQILVNAGARQIMSEYGDDGCPVGIAFAADTAMGMRSFVVPVNSDAVLTVLKRDRSVPASKKVPAHAERVAWRIVKDWLEAQLAIIRTEMVTLDQVMLPYMRGDNGRTIFELYREQQLALPAAT